MSDNAHDICCPSGLRGTIRGMKVKDEQLFTDKKLSRQGKVITELLRACWLSTTDPGPYPQVSPGGGINFVDLLAADRISMLVQLRSISHGSDYSFQVTCPNCRNRFGWEVNLEELDTKPVSDAGLQHVRTGEPLLITMADGRVIKGRLLTGRDEEFIAGLGVKDENKILIYNLAKRVVEIDGKTEWSDILERVEDMDARTADGLWDIFDELEGGVDTMFNIACPRCDTLQTTMLPFEASFFSSRKRFAPSMTRGGG